MTRWAVLIALSTVAALQAQPPAANRLTLEPRAAPMPALKYLLLPELRDRKSGNAVSRYYRSFSPEWQGHRRDPMYLQKLHEMAGKPLRELTPADLTPYAQTTSLGLLRDVDEAARRTYCDWELIDRFREQGIGMLLPDVQTFRELAVLLQMSARQELLANQYDKAARTLQTGLAMSRHLAEAPTLIQGLVAAASVSAMLQAVEDWIDRPGSPNLYWALTDLPRPFLSLRNGFEGERLTIDHFFPGYREMLADRTAPLAAAGVSRIIQEWERLMDQEIGQQWNRVTYAARVYPAAKRFLREAGRTAEEIDKMPALQVVFLYEVHAYDIAYDDVRKWLNLPFPEAAPKMTQAGAAAARLDRATVAAMLIPAVAKVGHATARVDRRIAALRCVEAIRLHAAKHGGKYPDRLDEITEVPVPRDPMTDRPFEYKREGDKATLVSPVSPHETRDAAVRYQLTLAATKEKH